MQHLYIYYQIYKRTLVIFFSFIVKEGVVHLNIFNKRIALEFVF